MESLFIHPENQTVLWNIIQRSSHWSEFSRTYTKISSPEKWFRQCIEAQYRKIGSSLPKISTPELSKKKWLLAQNKEVLQTMTSEIQEFVKYSGGAAEAEAVGVRGNLSPFGLRERSSSEFVKDLRSTACATDVVNLQFSPKVPSSGETKSYTEMYSTVEESPTLVYSSSRNYDIPPISAFDMEQERKAKYEKAKLEFEQYQTQYNRLLQPFAPPAPDFGENGAQSKIENMEELLIIQQKMRDTDYDMFSPPPPPPPNRENIRKEVEVGIEHSATSRMKPENLLTTPMKTEVQGFFGKKSQFEQIDMDKRSVSWSPALFT